MNIMPEITRRAHAGRGIPLDVAARGGSTAQHHLPPRRRPRVGRRRLRRKQGSDHAEHRQARAGRRALPEPLQHHRHLHGEPRHGADGTLRISARLQLHARGSGAALHREVVSGAAAEGRLLHRICGEAGLRFAGRKVRGVWTDVRSMGRWSGADGLCDGEERGHREVCGKVSAFLAGLRSVGAGFPESGEAGREAVLHERELQGAAHALHAGPDRHEALRGPDLHSPAELWRGECETPFAAVADQPRRDGLSRMGEGLR